MKMKNILKTTGKGVLIFLGIVVFYLLCGFLIPYIKIDEEKVTEPETVEAYILTNGVHTDLVVPVKSEQIDWSK